jgi:hypothetical protein
MEPLELEQFRVGAQAIYAVPPGESFPLELDANRYVPVDLARARAWEHQAAEIVAGLERLCQLPDGDERYRRFVRLVPRNARDKGVVLFYALGYRLDNWEMVDARYVTDLESWIERHLLRDIQRDKLDELRRRNSFRIRLTLNAIAITQAYRQHWQRRAERATYIAVNIILPMAEIERLILTEALLFALGGSVISAGFRILRWGQALYGLARSARLLEQAQAFISGTRLVGGGRVLAELARPYLALLAYLALKALDIKDNLELAAKVFGQMVVILKGLYNLQDFNREVAESGGALAGWSDVADDTERAFLERIAQAVEAQRRETEPVPAPEG